MTMFSVLVITLISILIPSLILLKFCIARNKLIEKSKNIQWARGSGLPLLIKCIGSTTQDFFSELQILYSHCPDIRKLLLGPELFVLVSKSEYIEAILNHPNALNKADFYRFFRPLFGLGIFTARDSLWRKHRKIVGSLFTKKFIGGHVDSMARHAKILIRKLQEGNQDEEEFGRNVSNCIMDTITETMLETETHMQENGSHMAEMYDQVFNIIFLRALKIWYYYTEFTFKWFSSMYKTQNDHMQEIDSFVSKIIHERTIVYHETIQDNDTNNSSFIMKIIDRCHRKSDYTEEQTHDEVNTMLVASVDTTATTLCFILMCLGIEQQVQDRVYDEITNVMGVSNDDITTTGDVKLEYTERVIKETLRIFPTGPYVGREASEDIIIGEENDRKVIPAGSQVIFSIFSLHRNPDYWPEPLKFDPDRFLPEEMSKQPSGHFMPFSSGVRNCVGWKWAMVALQSLLVTILREFRIKSEYKTMEEVELYSHLLLRTTNGFKISLEPRRSS